MKSSRIALLMYIKLGRSYKRCGGIENTLRNKMRFTFMITSRITMRSFERNYEQVRYFLEDR